jgi:hypothetical protein
VVGEIVAHDSRLRFGSLNHVRGGTINPQKTIAADAKYSDFTSAFGGTADMAGPAAGSTPVVNDPGCVKMLCCCYDSLVILWGVDEALC